jgi:hypothetical protein
VESQPNAKLDDDCTDRIVHSDAAGGTQIVVPDRQQVDHVDSAVPAAAPPVDYKIERILSAVMVVLCYLTNWYSAYNGHPQYLPEWVIGVCLGGLSTTPYQWIKDKLSNR